MQGNAIEMGAPGTIRARSVQVFDGRTMPKTLFGFVLGVSLRQPLGDIGLALEPEAGNDPGGVVRAGRFGQQPGTERHPAA